MQQAWHVSEEETVVDVPFREIVGSLMWIANQTRPDIANAVWAVARFSHDPKPVHYKAAQKILEYLNATSDLAYLLGEIVTWSRCRWSLV